MRRFLQVRILFVLIALLLVPAIALPFAERLRAEWARYWAPQSKPEAALEEGVVIGTLPGGTSVVCVCKLPNRAVRQQQFLETMAQIEATGISFEDVADEPPLMYPDEELGYPFGNWREKLRERAGEQVPNVNP